MNLAKREHEEEGEVGEQHDYNGGDVVVTRNAVANVMEGEEGRGKEQHVRAESDR